MKGILLACLAAILVLTGCFSLPTQRGTWTGTVSPVVLFDAKGDECVCAAFEVTGGPALKTYVPRRLVLVTADLATYAANAFESVAGGRGEIRVTGRIMSEFPSCAASGSVLTGFSRAPTNAFPGIYVLRVARIEDALEGTGNLTPPRNRD